MFAANGISAPVLAFAMEMQAHLKKNGYGDESAWKDVSVSQKLAQLRLAVARLETTLNALDDSLAKRFTVDSQAAVVGCFAMMVAHKEGIRG